MWRLKKRALSLMVGCVAIGGLFVLCKFTIIPILLLSIWAMIIIGVILIECISR